MTRRAGVTLIELIVVLVLMGLAAAIVAPSLRPPRAREDAPLRRVVAETRGAALRRGEAVVLTVERDGRWAATSRASGDTLPGFAAALNEPRATPLRMEISPLGTCVFDPELTPSSATLVWDPTRCELRERGDTAR